MSNELTKVQEAHRLSKSPVVIGMLSGIVGRDVDIGIEGHEGLAFFDGGKLSIEDDKDDYQFGSVTDTRGNIVIFALWMLDKVEADWDGSLFLSLGYDASGASAPQRCYDELERMNDWDDWEVGQ